MEESYDSIYSKLTKKWLTLEVNHRMSLTASNEFWKLATSCIPTLIAAKTRERINRKIPQFRSIRQTLYKKYVPRISLEFGYEVKDTGDIIIMSDLECAPTSKFPPTKFKKLYESAEIKVIPLRAILLT